MSFQLFTKSCVKCGGIVFGPREGGDSSVPLPGRSSLRASEANRFHKFWDVLCAEAEAQGCVILSNGEAQQIWLMAQAFVRSNRYGPQSREEWEARNAIALRRALERLLNSCGGRGKYHALECAAAVESAEKALAGTDTGEAGMLTAILGVREAVDGLPRDAIREELLWEIDQALAAAARQGGDVKQAPGEAPQSGGEAVTPKEQP